MAQKKSTTTKKKSTSSKSSSSTINVNKVIKSTKKMAKKNPKGFAVLAIIVVLLIGAGIGGYFAYKYFNPII